VQQQDLCLFDSNSISGYLNSVAKIQLLFIFFELKLLNMNICRLKFLLILLPIFYIGQSPAALSEQELLQQLRADYASLVQARNDFEALKSRGNPRAEEVADFADWISQLRDQLFDDCQKLAAISSAPLPADLPCSRLSARNPAPAKIDITAEATEAQKTKQLTDQLNGSLGEFDERLLREQDRIKARTPQTETTASSKSGGAYVADQADDSGNTLDNTGDGGQAGQQSQRAGETDNEGTRTASNGMGTPASSSSGTEGSIPEDIPDGSDDDIIARQIREAAEKETDPELRAKLWDEYRRYREAIH
jgi:hypothetical protein